MRSKIQRITVDFPVNELDHPAWATASPVTVDRYWSGQTAPSGRQFTAQLLWSDDNLYVRFEANQDEPLNLNPRPDLSRKTIGLWDFDVCEIFIAPDPNEPRRYFEFEVSPTGEWIDLGVHQMIDRRETDWEFESRMRAAGTIGDGKVVMSISIPWRSIGRPPATGDVWRGNILRCVGTDPGRGYLAWSPTETEIPNFHVPERFGEFVFVD